MPSSLIALATLWALVGAATVPPLVQQVEFLNKDFEGLTCANFTNVPGVSDGCDFSGVNDTVSCSLSPAPFTGASPCSVRVNTETDAFLPWGRVASTDDSGIIETGFVGDHEDPDLTQSNDTKANFPSDPGSVSGYLHHSGLRQLLNGTIDSRTHYTFTAEYCTTAAITIGTVTLRVYPAATDNSTVAGTGLADVESVTLCSSDRAQGCFADLGEFHSVDVDLDTTATAPNATCDTLTVRFRHYELFGHVGVNTFVVEALFEGSSGAVLVDNFDVQTETLPDFVTPGNICTPIFINEIDYIVANDNSEAPSLSTNAIEIAGPVGADITGWQILLVDGETNTTYVAGHINRPTKIPEGTLDIDEIGHLTFTFSGGVMNGENNFADAVLLLDQNGAVVQFLCYGPNITTIGPEITVFDAAGTPTIQNISATCEHIFDITGDAQIDLGVDSTLSLRGCGQCYEDFDWQVSTDTTHGADGDIGLPSVALPGAGQNNDMIVNMTGGARNQQQHFCIDHDLDGYWDGITNAAPNAAGLTQTPITSTQCCGGNDCQPRYGHIHPNAEEICDGFDSDCDGVRPETGVTSELDADGDGRLVCDGDCQDDNDAVFGLAGDGTDFATSDNRFFINQTDLPLRRVEEGAQCAAVPDASVASFTVCEIGTELGVTFTFDEQAETCDGLDNNCNIGVDEGLGAQIEHFPDVDNDGYADPDIAQTNIQFLANCTNPPNTKIGRIYPLGWAPLVGDCDDSDPTSSPEGIDNTCNGVDNDCNGFIDDDLLDFDGDGFPANNCSTATGAPGNRTKDCNDNAATAFPGNTVNIDSVSNDTSISPCDNLDNDCDGFVDDLGVVDADFDGFPAVSCATSDNATARQPQDCDDTNAAVNPNATDATAFGDVDGCDGLDTNCDGFTDPVELDVDQDNFVACGTPTGTIPGGDCDDFDNTTFPGAPDLCESPCGNFDTNGVADPTQVTCQDQCPNDVPQLGKDNNCNGEKDEGVLATRDADGDGYPLLCLSSDVTALRGDANGCGDCSDSTFLDAFAALRAPNKTEICDGIDNDCDQDNNGVTEFGNFALPANEADADGDLVRLCDIPRDCDDTRANVLPGHDEVCGDSLDNDCDGHVDNRFDDASRFDRDGDFHPIFRCPTADNDTLSFQSVDCNDNDETVFPGAPEVTCDGQENDCDADDFPAVPVNEQDQDGDGYLACQECDDGNAAIHPGAIDICNEIDDNCNTQVDEFFIDEDGDGSPREQCDTAPNGSVGSREPDCDDNDASNGRLLDEADFLGDDGFGDRKDNDCDGVADNGLPRLVGDATVIQVVSRKRHASSSSSSSTPAEPIDVKITLTVRNTGDTSATGVVVKGKISLPHGAKITTASVAQQIQIVGNEFTWFVGGVDANDDENQLLEIEVERERDVRQVRVIAAITETAGFTPHVVFTSF